jgi:hypothetical protein
MAFLQFFAARYLSLVPPSYWPFLTAPWFGGKWDMGFRDKVQLRRPFFFAGDFFFAAGLADFAPFFPLKMVSQPSE